MKTLLFCLFLTFFLHSTTLKPIPHNEVAESIFAELWEGEIACKLFMICKTVTTNVTISPAERKHPQEILIFSADNAEDFQCACDHIALHNPTKFIGVIVMDRRKLPDVFDKKLLESTEPNRA